MALGREVDHRRGPLLGEDPGRPAVRDVAEHEGEAGVVEDVRQVLQATGIGELVEHDDPGRGLRESEPDEVATDESGTAGDERVSMAAEV